MSISLWSTVVIVEEKLCGWRNDILHDRVFLRSALRVPETPITWMAAGFSLISVMEAMEARTISRALWEQRTMA